MAVLGATTRIVVETRDGSSAAGTRVRVRRRGSSAEPIELTVQVAGATATAEFFATEPGWYDYRAWRPGSPAFATEGRFFVDGSRFTADPPGPGAIVDQNAALLVRLVPTLSDLGAPQDSDTWVAVRGAQAGRVSWGSIRDAAAAAGAAAAGAGVAAQIEAALDLHEAAPDPHPEYTTVSEAAAAAPVQSVAGRTGNVVLTPADAGADPAGTAASLTTAAQARTLAYYSAQDFVVEQAGFIAARYGAANLTAGSPAFNPSKVFQAFMDFMEVQDFYTSMVCGLWPSGFWAMDYQFTQAEWNRRANGQATGYNGWPGAATSRANFRTRSRMRLRFSPRTRIEKAGRSNGHLGMFTVLSSGQAYDENFQDPVGWIDITGDRDCIFYERPTPGGDFGGTIFQLVNSGPVWIRDIHVRDLQGFFAIVRGTNAEWANRTTIEDCTMRNPIGALGISGGGAIVQRSGCTLAERCDMMAVDDTYIVWPGTPPADGTPPGPMFPVGDAIFRDCQGGSLHADFIKVTQSWNNNRPIPEPWKLVGGSYAAPPTAPYPETHIIPTVLFQRCYSRSGGFCVKNDASAGKIRHVRAIDCDLTSTGSRPIEIRGAFGGVGRIELDVRVHGVTQGLMELVGKVDEVVGRIICDPAPLGYHPRIDLMQLYHHRSGRVDLEVAFAGPDQQTGIDPTTGQPFRTVSNLIEVGQPGYTSANTGSPHLLGDGTEPTAYYIGDPYRCIAGPTVLRFRNVSNIINTARVLNANRGDDLTLMSLRPVAKPGSAGGHGVRLRETYEGRVRLIDCDFTGLAGIGFQNQSPATDIDIDPRCRGVGAIGVASGAAGVVTYRPGVTLYRLTSGAEFTGFSTVPGNVVAVSVVNATGAPITIPPAAGNLTLPGGRAVTLAAGARIEFLADPVSGTWRTETVPGAVTTTELDRVVVTAEPAVPGLSMPGIIRPQRYESLNVDMPAGDVIYMALGYGQSNAGYGGSGPTTSLTQVTDTFFPRSLFSFATTVAPFPGSTWTPAQVAASLSCDTHLAAGSGASLVEVLPGFNQPKTVTVTGLRPFRNPPDSRNVALSAAWIAAEHMSRARGCPVEPRIAYTVSSGASHMSFFMPADFRYAQRNLAIDGADEQTIKGAPLTYLNLIAAVTEAKAIADALGRRLIVDVVAWCQGEGNLFSNGIHWLATNSTTPPNGQNSMAHYEVQLELLMDRISTDVRAITGQAERPLSLLMQIALNRNSNLGNSTSPDRFTRNAFATLPRRRPNDFWNVGTLYAAPFTSPDSSGGIHHTETERLHLASSYAVAMTRQRAARQRGQTPAPWWIPRINRELSHWRAADTLRIVYEKPVGMTGALTVDTDWIGDAVTGAPTTNLGFRYTGTDGSLSGAAKVANEDAVDLTITGNTDAAAVVEYAMSIATDARWSAGRGLLYVPDPGPSPFNAMLGVGPAWVRHYAAAEQVVLPPKPSETLAAIAALPGLEWFVNANSPNLNTVPTIHEWRDLKAGAASRTVFTGVSSSVQGGIITSHWTPAGWWPGADAQSVDGVNGTRGGLNMAGGITPPSFAGNWLVAVECVLTSIVNSTTLWSYLDTDGAGMRVSFASGGLLVFNDRGMGNNRQIEFGAFLNSRLLIIITRVDGRFELRVNGQNVPMRDQGTGFAYPRTFAPGLGPDMTKAPAFRLFRNTQTAGASQIPNGSLRSNAVVVGTTAQIEAARLLLERHGREQGLW